MRIPHPKLISRWFLRHLPCRQVPGAPQISRSELWTKLYDILVKQLKCPTSSVTLNARFKEDLGIDSLESVELIMLIEETFGLEIKDEDAENLKKVSDVLGYLEGKMTRIDRNS